MEKLLLITLRTILFYVVITVIFRLMGKREIGELSILDLVVFIMLAEMAVTSIEDHTDPLINTLLPMIVLLLIQLGVSYLSLKSRGFRRLTDGKPSVLINKGKIDRAEMKKNRYNFDDLLMQLRDKDIANISDVEFAILETSGQLSVVKKDEKSSFTLPLIQDGDILQEHIERIGKTESWLLRELKKRGHDDINKISFCSYQKGKFFIDYMD